MAIQWRREDSTSGGGERDFYDRREPRLALPRLSNG